MSTQEQFFQQFESLFEHYNHALSPSSPATGDVAPCETGRLLAAARLAIQEMEANADVRKSGRGFFAKPGEAEWGC